jgi:hypothetical protein
MGQALFSPPNVKGWRTGTDWLNSATMLARNNFAEAVAVKERAGQLNVAEAKNDDDPTAPKVHLPTRRSNYILPNLFGAELFSDSTTPVKADQDSVDLLCSGKPKTHSELIVKMGELLFGERLPIELAERIERFLREPAAIANAKSPTTVQSNYLPPQNLPVAPTKTALPAIPIPSVDNPKLAPPPREVNKKPNRLNPQSPEFNLRVREALHAMMCLPEYQLN